MILSLRRCIFINEGRFFHHRRAENTLLIRPSHICIRIGKSSGICIYVRWCGARCFWSSAATLWTHNVDTRTAAKETPHQTRSAFISHQLGWLLTCVTGLCLSRAAAAQEEETGLGFLLLFCCFDARRVIIQYIIYINPVCVLLNSSSLCARSLDLRDFCFYLCCCLRRESCLATCLGRPALRNRHRALHAESKLVFDHIQSLNLKNNITVFEVKSNKFFSSINMHWDFCKIFPKLGYIL